MIRCSVAALAVALAATPLAAQPAGPQGKPGLRPLAPELAAATTSPARETTLAATLADLARATPATRQRRRWNHALALLAAKRPDEARGVLAVLAADEPDLRLVPAWRITAGRAAVETGLHAEGLALLDDPVLSGVGEACAWRLRALAALGAAGPALAQLSCAKPALAARSPAERAPFLYAAAASALAAERPDAAQHFLRFAPSAPPRARLLQAEALLRRDQPEAAERLLAPLARTPDGAVAALAEALRIEAAARLRSQPPAATLARAEAHRLGWRGDLVERRMALLSWDLALAAGKPRSALSAAAVLLRHHPSEPRLPSILGIVNANFRRWLEPGSKVPLPLAAGLLWDHRDMLPNGAEGDSMVRLLAGRLSSEGLHARAADLLEHQLAFRARDLAQGPLSVDVAQLRLLAGEPEKARAVIRASDNILYPEPFASSRARLEAIALFQLGKGAEAIALLTDLPGTADLREELLWRARDWERLARSPLGAGPGRPNPVTQVRLLRQAIALAMIGDEGGLALLRARYARSLVGLPAAAAFEALSGKGGASSGAALAEALAALPAVSPAGMDADLIDLSDAAFRARRAPPSPRG